MSDQGVRRHVLDLLRSRGAHADFEATIRGLRPEHRGKRVPGLARSAWELLEHLRIVQWDILEFSRSADHVSPEFPGGYWPDGPGPPDSGAWKESAVAFRADLQALCDLVEDPRTDLFAELAWGDGQTVLREALLVADHNAYHLGQLVLLRRLLGDWPPGQP